MRLQNIVSETSFYWWLPYFLKKKNHIIAAVNNRIKKFTQANGVDL